jgi:hypothetical protein
VKEFLAVRGIAFESVNVLDAGGMEKLRALGARSIPVVARGGKFVFAQVIKDVVEFLALDEATGPALSPAALAARYDRVLAAAVSSVRQMPDACLERQLPNRPRSWRVLMHHLFQIPTEFLDALAEPRPLAYEQLVAPPPDGMTSAAAIAGFGDDLHRRFVAWWRDEGAALDFHRPFQAYFGETSLHEMLERTVWHSTQHVRQVQDLLRQAGIEPADPLGPADIAGLPLTEKVWDE